MIRIMFESITDRIINDPDKFQNFIKSSNICKTLEALGATFGGSIVVDANRFELTRLEPLWQYIIDSNDKDYLAKASLVFFEDSLEGYKIHFEDH